MQARPNPRGTRRARSPRRKCCPPLLPPPCCLHLYQPATCTAHALVSRLRRSNWTSKLHARHLATSASLLPESRACSRKLNYSRRNEEREVCLGHLLEPFVSVLTAELGTDRAAREELLTVTRTAFEEHARQLKADLAPILQDLVDSVRASEARASRSAIDAKSAAARGQADLDRRLEAVRETALRDSLRTTDASATLAVVQQIDEKLQGVAKLLAEQDGRIARLEMERSAKAAVEGEVSSQSMRR